MNEIHQIKYKLLKLIRLVSKGSVKMQLFKSPIMFLKCSDRVNFPSGCVFVCAQHISTEMPRFWGVSKICIYCKSSDLLHKHAQTGWQRPFANSSDTAIYENACFRVRVQALHDNVMWQRGTCHFAGILLSAVTWQQHNHSKCFFCAGIENALWFHIAKHMIKINVS